MKNKENKYKMPTKSDLKSRSSTISNAFAISITPYIRPTDEELKEYYSQLKIEEGQCAYCLGVGNGRDHLKPLVSNRKPTGYITDIHNLVPCCQRCNSSKGSKSFQEWYKSSDNVNRLKKMGLTEEKIDERYKVICSFEEKIPARIDYKSIVGDKLWKDYIKRRNKMLEELKDNQKFCDELNKKVMRALKQNR